MMIRKPLLQFGLVTGSLFFSALVLAAQPVERFHVAYSENLTPVLVKTIGVLTINSYPNRIKNGTEVKLYSKKGNSFAYSKTLKMIEQTTPLSNFGYDSLAERGIIEDFRYPITARSGKFLRIAYEPSKDLEGWVNLEEMRAKFGVALLFLDSIQTPSAFFIDIFHFLKESKRKIYSEPNEKADFVLLSKDNPKYFLFRILELKDGFAKIAAVLGMGNGEEPRETLGWIKLRDKRGVLTVWIIYADLC